MQKLLFQIISSKTTESNIEQNSNFDLPKKSLCKNKNLAKAPALCAVNLNLPLLNWYYYTKPQKNLDNRRLYWPRFISRFLFNQLNYS